MSKTFTSSDVAAHNKTSDLFVVVDEDVYDLTKFQDEHPGKYLTKTQSISRLTDLLGGKKSTFPSDPHCDMFLTNSPKSFNALQAKTLPNSFGNTIMRASSRNTRLYKWAHLTQRRKPKRLHRLHLRQQRSLQPSHKLSQVPCLSFQLDQICWLWQRPQSLQMYSAV